jgi:hypothetical protein
MTPLRKFHEPAPLRRVDIEPEIDPLEAAAQAEQDEDDLRLQWEMDHPEARCPSRE